MKSSSIKFEISFLYTLILGLILVIFSAVLYFLLSFTLYNELDQELKLKAEEISQVIRAYTESASTPEGALTFAIQKTISGQYEPTVRRFRKIDYRWSQRAKEMDLSDDYINFVSQDGVSIERSSSLSEKLLPLFLANVQLNDQSQMTFRNVIFQNKRIRIINYPFRYQDESYVIQVGISQNPLIQLLQNWLYSLIVSIPIILILTTFVSRIIASRLLDSVQQIIQTAQQITFQDLSSRVKAKHYYAEMNDLVEAFNNMISRLERSFKHIEEFSSHVSHELKTPLAIIKGESELALRKERPIEEYQRVISVNLEESDRMLKTIEDLLLLTKLDYQPEVFHFEPFDFKVFFMEIYEQSKILAAKKNIHINLNIEIEKTPMEGDRLHLRRLFFNLIDNALKYSTQGGAIQLAVCRENGQVIASVKDNGVGISPEDLNRIFERFFRTAHIESGNGLGLHIARSIARIHHGDITVESKFNEGATFRVILPAT